MFKHRYSLMNEFEGNGSDAGGVEGGVPTPSGESGDAPPAEGWLRDISEDQAYDTMMQARQFPDHIRGLESRLFGRMGPITERLNTLEKSLGSRVSLDSDKIKSALDAYDPTGALSEALVPALSEALAINPLDEGTLAPHLDPVRDEARQWAAEQIVLSQYDPEDIRDIIPETKDGRFDPQTQRQKDFVNWYSRQGYDVQQSLLEFGAPYVRALKRFEKWEAQQLEDRKRAAGDKSNRLNGGQQPSSQGRRSSPSGPQTPEEAFLAGFNEVD